MLLSFVASRCLSKMMVLGRGGEGHKEDKVLRGFEERLHVGSGSYVRHLMFSRG